LFLFVAIDGPAGAGKSTIARMLAQRFNINYMDTGAMYRAITLKIIRKNVSLSDEESLRDLLNNTSIELVNPLTENLVFLDGEDVTEEIRGSEVNQWVSQVSSLKMVRQAMVEQQRQLAHKWEGVVMDGRDIGTCVLPEASFKFYLDASQEERTRRRWQELKDKGKELPWEEVEKTITQRDDIDKNRSESPLKVPPGAVVLDTTHLDIEGVLQKVTEYIKQQKG